MRSIIALSLSACGALALAEPAHATILTFDIAGGTADHQAIPQGYGDNVAASPQAGHRYGVDAEGFTPNVAVDYGSPGEVPALWTTGYGDLTNVHFNDQDGDTTFTVLFTADAGFQVNLIAFDLASFLANGQTTQGLSLRDVGSNNLLFSLGPTFVTGATHLQVAPNVTAQQLALVIDLTGLESVSDDIGIDNIRFGQVVDTAPPPSVPEPATVSLLAVGLLGIELARHARRERPGKIPR